jgi:hypothetical protein
MCRKTECSWPRARRRRAREDAEHPDGRRIRGLPATISSWRTTAAQRREAGQRPERLAPDARSSGKRSSTPR